MNLRAVTASFKQQSMQFVADPQWIIPSIIAPFVFTVVMLFMYPDRSDEIVLQAVLGGGVLGMWGNTLFASSFTLSYDRMNGTLENILVTPTDLYDVILGRSLWNTFIGLLNMLLVYVFATLMFSVNVSIAHPLEFVMILVLTLLSLSSIGMIFSIAFVFSRRSYVLTSILQYPIYILSGAVVPITVLPQWTNPISMILPPTWGVESLRASALTGYEVLFGPGYYGNVMVCALLSLIYFAIAWFLMRRIVSNVKANGSFTRY